MKSLSRQFSDKINKQFSAFQVEGAKTIAEGIITQMEQNVDRGVGFDSNSSKYERNYADRTIKERKKGGFQTKFADLQRDAKRVKTAFVRTDANMATIRFAQQFEGGHSILLLHQWGLGHLPRRQLFPDIIGGGQNSKGSGKLEEPNSIPRRVIKETHKLGTKLMNKPV